jgi:hypothetical protein
MTPGEFSTFENLTTSGWVKAGNPWVNSVMYRKKCKTNENFADLNKISLLLKSFVNILKTIFR